LIVIPAEAGIQRLPHFLARHPGGSRDPALLQPWRKSWIPAFAGMTSQGTGSRL